MPDDSDDPDGNSNVAEDVSVFALPSTCVELPDGADGDPGLLQFLEAGSAMSVRHPDGSAIPLAQFLTAGGGDYTWWLGREVGTDRLHGGPGDHPNTDGKPYVEDEDDLDRIYENIAHAVALPVGGAARFVDPSTHRVGQLINPGGRGRLSGRANNCLESAMAGLRTFYGAPTPAMRRWLKSVPLQASNGGAMRQRFGQQVLTGPVVEIPVQ